MPNDTLDGGISRCASNRHVEALIRLCVALHRTLQHDGTTMCPAARASSLHGLDWDWLVVKSDSCACLVVLRQAPEAAKSFQMSDADV